MDKFKQNLDKFEEVGTVSQVLGSLVYVTGLPSARYGEVLLFESGEIGKISELGKSHIEVLVLSNEVVKINTKVAKTGDQFTIDVGEHLLGHIVNPLGNIEGKPVSRAVVNKSTRKLVDISPPGIENRANVDSSLASGVGIVDLAIPLGKGQSQLIIGNRKT